MILFTDALVIVSIVILVGLFSIQQFGTGKVGFTFAPALALWFFSLGTIGIYNLIKHDITVLRALNPAYIYFFFEKNTGKAWSALGGCVLCITGMLSTMFSFWSSHFLYTHSELIYIPWQTAFCIYIESLRYPNAFLGKTRLFLFFFSF